MKKIAIILFLLLLSIAVGVIIILEQNKNMENSSQELTENIEKELINFTIKKEEDKEVEFIGSFSKVETPKDIAKLLNGYKIDHRIKIDPELLTDKKAILLVKEILKKLNNSYISWSIVYKNSKLLVTGKSISLDDKESVENLLELSSIDSFSNIEFIKEGNFVVSKLKEIVENEDKKENPTPTEDEAKEILSNLQLLAIPDNHNQKKETKKKKVIKKRKKLAKIDRVKKYSIKKIPKKKRRRKRIIKRAKKIEKKSIKNNNILDEKESEIDILSLPPIEPVDMHIEEKIQRGIIEPPRVSKPIIHEKTIYIKPSDEKIKNSNIPWAKLHDVNEPLDGILINESIN